MNTTTSAQETLPLEDPNPCQIVVLSEDSLAHELAMEACGGMLVRFANEMHFSFNFWRFNDLKDLQSAHRAAISVARADIVVLSLHGDGLASETLHWLETEIAPRTKLEGALALMVANPSATGPAFRALLLQLERLAARLGMDFLPLVPMPPDVTAGQSAHLPPELLNQPPANPGYEHWGLNE